MAFSRPPLYNPDEIMTVHLSENLAEALRRLAATQGRELDDLVDEAVHGYLVAASITDVTAEDLAATQVKLASELPGLEPCEAKDGGRCDEAS